MVSLQFAPRSSASPRRRPGQTGPQSLWAVGEIGHRLGGIGLVAAAAVTCLGAESLGSSVGPALQLAAQMLAFCLACFGLLLAIEGRAIRERWQMSLSAKQSGQSESEPVLQSAAELEPMLLWDNGIGGGRTALTAFLIMRAQQEAVRRRAGAKTGRRSPSHSLPERESRD